MGDGTNPTTPNTMPGSTPAPVTPVTSPVDQVPPMGETPTAPATGDTPVQPETPVVETPADGTQTPGGTTGTGM